MKIIFEDNHLLVVLKPVNVPICKDSSNDLDLLSMLKNYLKNKYDKKGNVYLAMVHRLDRPVGGLVLFCKTDKAASRISKQIQDHTFKKTYVALVKNTNLKNHDVYQDKLLKDTKTNTTKIDNNGKDCKLEYEIIHNYKNYALVKIKLYTGRSHQIRVQFASRHQYLYGDQRYNPNSNNKEQICLFAQAIEFVHPITKHILHFESNDYHFKNIGENL